MAAKTYAECERETRDKLDSAIGQSERGNLALRLELAVNLAASNAYQIEKLLDDRNTVEMHALHDRMAGK